MSQYKAFISYRHTEPDKPLAIALQKQLENYRIPRYLRKQGMPSGLGKIFRDESDLPTSCDLDNQIQTALDDSEYLIVICSTHAPLSKYIAAEIDYFKRTKGDAKVLALLVEGDPSTQNVFPEALLKRYHAENRDIESLEPIAADVRAATARARIRKLKKSKIKIVAGLLGCNYDELVRREKEKKLKRSLMASLAVLVFFMGIGALLLHQVNAVNESQRLTKLAYAQQSLFSGDHVVAMEQAASSMTQSVWPFSPVVDKKTKDMVFMASLVPAFSQITKIPLMGQQESAFFSSDGNRVIVQSDLFVKVYDVFGMLQWEYNVSEPNSRIAAVSKDGSRAAIIRTWTNGQLKSTISLWDIQNSVKIADLISSQAYNVYDVLEYNFADVLDAAFSPDNRFVFACRKGGYFNENDSISIWNAQTGQMEKSFDGALLGTREDGGQGKTVDNFAYQPNGLLFITGSANYVYYHMDWTQPLTIPIRDTTGTVYDAISDNQRFGIYTDQSGKAVVRDRAAQKEYTSVSYFADTKKAVFVNDELLILPLLDESENYYVGIQAINIMTMQDSKTIQLNSDSVLGYKNIGIVAGAASDSVYLLGEKCIKKILDTGVEQETARLWKMDCGDLKETLLNDNLGYLTEGEWTHALISVRDTDFFFSKRIDKKNMMSLAIKENTLNVYHIESADEFDLDNIQVNDDGSMLLVQDSGSVRILSTADMPSPEFEDGCFAGALNQEGMIATLSDGEVRLWNNNQLQWTMPAESEDQSLAVSDESNVMAVYTQSMAATYDAKTGNENCRVLFEQALDEFALSPDGGVFAAISGGKLQIYDAISGKLLQELTDTADNDYPLDGWSQKMVFSPDGSTIACVVQYHLNENDYTRAVMIWDVRTFQRVGFIPSSYISEKQEDTYAADSQRFPPSVESVIYSDDGTQIGAAFGGSVWIYNVQTKSLASVINETGAPQSPLVINSKKSLLYYHVNNVLNGWDIADGNKTVVFHLDSGIGAWAVSPDDRWILGANVDGVWLMDAATGERLVKMLGGPVDFINWTGSGRYICSHSYVNGTSLQLIPYDYDSPQTIYQNWILNKES